MIKNDGKLRSQRMMENDLQSASVVPHLQLAAGHHKECLGNTKITKSAYKIQKSQRAPGNFKCRLPKFVIDKMKHYMKLWSFETAPQCHPSSPCPCSSRVGSDHFQFRKACPALPSSPPSGPRWTGEKKSKMSCKKTREQQGAKQEKREQGRVGNKNKSKACNAPGCFHHQEICA